MDNVIIARSLHVLAVVIWIGGVAFVTTVLLPAVRRIADRDDRTALFEQVERSFARQARFTTLLTGLTGLYMVDRLQLWARFLVPGY